MYSFPCSGGFCALNRGLGRAPWEVASVLLFYSFFYSTQASSPLPLSRKTTAIKALYIQPGDEVRIELSAVLRCLLHRGQAGNEEAVCLISVCLSACLSRGVILLNDLYFRLGVDSSNAY